MRLTIKGPVEGKTRPLPYHFSSLQNNDFQEYFYGASLTILTASATDKIGNIDNIGRQHRSPDKQASETSVI